MGYTISRINKPFIGYNGKAFKVAFIRKLIHFW